MKNITPFFEINGTRYEIKRNRYLQAEFDKLKSELKFTDEEQVALAKEEDFENRLEKLTARKKELYDKWLETFDENDEELYKKACVAYDNLLEQEGKGESIIAKQRKSMIDMGEKLIIKSLKMNEHGDIIRTEKEAEEIWCALVDEYGQVSAMEFVVFTLNYITGADQEIENPFMTQAKAKAEQKANMRKGILKAK
jgi:hypothetical protein